MYQVSECNNFSKTILMVLRVVFTASGQSYKALHFFWLSFELGSMTKVKENAFCGVKEKPPLKTAKVKCLLAEKYLETARIHLKFSC